MGYDDWKAHDSRYDDPYAGGHTSRAADERQWWVNFHRAKAKGEVQDFLEMYEGNTIYAVLVEDAKRLLEADDRRYEDLVDSGSPGDALTLRRDR